MMHTKFYITLAGAFATLAIAGCGTANQGNPSTTTVNSSSQRQSPAASSTANSGASQRSMDHGAMGAMPGMDHSKAENMNTMPHAQIGGVEGVDSNKMGAMKGMDHSAMGKPTQKTPAAATQPDHTMHGSSAAGKPGDPAKATRTVNVKASDTMRFEPRSLQVKAGETIRFVVTNVGKVPHEFVVGTPTEQKEHAQMMQKMPEMKHEEANAISLAPGETKTLVWQFGNTQSVELACHVPGHYPAGMVSKVTVSAIR